MLLCYIVISNWSASLPANPTHAGRHKLQSYSKTTHLQNSWLEFQYATRGFPNLKVTMVKVKAFAGKSWAAAQIWLANIFVNERHAG